MAAFSETKVASEFAKAISSAAVTITTMQACIWLFGGCALEPEANAYMDCVAKYHSYDSEQDGYDRKKFVSFMTTVIGANITMAIGAQIAEAAADIVEDQF
uniref:Uncharacterized protein n=1 Tax=Pseudomonas phage Cygsa01 TaxID=3138529 RepID=A0AAU6W3P6_9VIRU